MKDAEYIISLLGLSEDDVVKSFLSAFVPLQPGVLRANWLNNESHGNTGPSTSEIWKKFVEADFRCTLCGSHRRITLDQIDRNAMNHDLSNLQVVCYDRNRKISSKGTEDEDAQLRIFRSFVKLHARLGRFPTNREILSDTGVQQIGGATYLLRFLQEKFGKSQANKRPEGTPGKSPSSNPSQVPGAPHP